MQNKVLYDLQEFQNNEIMIADYYVDMNNLKLFIRPFHFFDSSN